MKTTMANDESILRQKVERETWRAITNCWRSSESCYACWLIGPGQISSFQKPTLYQQICMYEEGYFIKLLQTGYFLVYYQNY